MLLGRKLLRGAGVAALLACPLLTAQNAYAGAWFADVQSGCQVWDPNPQIDETVAWSGPCANGRAEGPGTVQWSKHNALIETDKGEWRDGRQAGKGIQTWSTGSYEGELLNGEPNGQGVLTLQKLRYEGEFRDGKPNGAGSLTEGGETVHGIWKDGCLRGGQRKASIGIPLSACR
jgi:MORN repeat